MGRTHTQTRGSAGSRRRRSGEARHRCVWHSSWPEAPVSCCLMILLLAACTATVQDVGRQAAGCYRLRLDTLYPAMGGDSVYFDPPTTIELTTQAFGPGGRFIVTPALFDGGTPGSWRPWADSIELRWHDGTTGVEMRAAHRGDTLAGTALSISDVVVPAEMRPSASFTAVRTACELAQ